MSRLSILVCLTLSAACTTTRQSVVVGVRDSSVPKEVKVHTLSGDQQRFDFSTVAREPILEQFRQEEAYAVLASFHEAFSQEVEYPFRVIRASTNAGPSNWQRKLRDEFVSRYGVPQVTLPESLETSPLLLALKLSPQYMGDGVRDAARELFNSPAFLSSVALSVLVYFSAWLLPEPVFSKAFVAALTLRLALAVGVLELNRFAKACVGLYQEAQHAKTVSDLEAVAARFGRAVGGSGLRVLVVVASMGLAKGLSQGPGGGLNALLSAPRFALPEGLFLSRGAAAVQMAADGTVIVTGTMVGLAGSSVNSACSDGAESKDGHRWHHLATNKNATSDRSGGPWTPLFEKLFTKAGMRLESAENLVYLKGHQGPHPAEYHSEVYRRLEESLGSCRTMTTCRGRLIQALKDIANEICTPGSMLHQWATKSE